MSQCITLCTFHFYNFHCFSTLIIYKGIISSTTSIQISFVITVFYPCHCKTCCFLAQNKNRINKAGELLVTSDLSRSQQRNLSDCIRKISAIIAEASEKPHEPTEEDIALRAKRYYPITDHNLFLSTLNICVLCLSLMWTMFCRLEKRNKERLNQKKILSAIKKNRRVDFD